jgi:UDP-N-acetylglucosamine acyltransferase
MAFSEPIHPTALVSPGAAIAAGVEIGPFAIVEDGVRIGHGCRIAAHAQILRGVDMGPDNTVDRGAVIGGEPQSLGFDRTLASGVRIGEGNVFREFVTVHRSTLTNGTTLIGNRNFVMAGAHLGHDSVLGDDNVLANSVLVGGHVTVGSRCFLGGGAGLHQFVRIGDFAMIQGNSAVSQDIPPYCMASGINVVDGINIVGLRRAGFDSSARLEIKRAWTAAYKSSAGPVKGAAHALESGDWSEAAKALLQFMAAGGKKGIACPGRRRRDS